MPEHYHDTTEPGKALLLTEEEFKSLFHSRYIGLCSFCQVKYGLDTDLAKEVVQTAFIRLWESRVKLTQPGAILPYLYKIIHNRSLDVLKHQKLHRMYSLLAIEEENYENHHYHGAELKQLSDAIRKAINRLPQQMRIIFEMSRYDGRKYSEIAESLGISVKTVETQVSRALQKLRVLLADHLIHFLLPLAIFI